MADQDLLDFFFNSDSDTFLYETLELTDDPTVQGDQLFVRNSITGITATTEFAEQEFTYLPMRFTVASIANNLDFGINIEMGVSDAFAVSTYVKSWVQSGADKYVTWRTYRNDDLTTMVQGPISLSIKNVTVKDNMMQVTARSKDLNRNRTGEIYTFERFSGLKGFL